MRNNFNVECLIENLAEYTDLFILAELSAKKGDIKTRKDLERYVFNCAGCKKTKPATEITILRHHPQTTITPKEDNRLMQVSVRMALLCQSCINLRSSIQNV